MTKDKKIMSFEKLNVNNVYQDLLNKLYVVFTFFICASFVY